MLNSLYSMSVGRSVLALLDPYISNTTLTDTKNVAIKKLPNLTGTVIFCLCLFGCLEYGTIGH